MSPKTFLVICIGAALTLGGAFLLRMLLQPATQVTSSQTSGNTQYEGQNQTSVTVSPAQTQTGTAIDPEKEYAQLFGKVLGQKINFTAVSSSTGELGSIYALYETEITAEKKEYPQISAFPIQIALVNLNGDDLKEAIVYNNLSSYCGSGGCALDIYKKAGGKWVNIFSGIAHDTVGIANTLTNGYTDLFVSIQGDIGAYIKVVRYTWDGKQYQPWEVVAVWDGTTFQTVQ